MFATASEAIAVIARLIENDQGVEVRILDTLPPPEPATASFLGFFVSDMQESPVARGTYSTPGGSTPPSTVDVVFLLVPVGNGSGEETLHVLAEAMDVLRRHPVVQGELLGDLMALAHSGSTKPDDLMGIQIVQQPSDSVRRIWDLGARRPYTLSSAYQARISVRGAETSASTSPS